MHGHERRAEDWRYNDHKLYAGLHAIKCKDQRRISQSTESKMTFINVFSDSFDVLR